MGDTGRERRDAADAAHLDEVLAGLQETAVVVSSMQAREVMLFASAMRLAQRRMERSASPVQRSREMEWRSIAAELGASLHLSDRTVQRKMDDALQLTELFPATVDALAGGRISVAHATAIHDTGSVIVDPDVRAAFEQVVLARAEQETPARTRAFARELAEALHPESIVTRHHDATQHRSVTVREVQDGMAELILLVPAAVAYAIHDRLTQQGRAIRAVAMPAPPPPPPGADDDPASRADADRAAHDPDVETAAVDDATVDDAAAADDADAAAAAADGEATGRDAGEGTGQDAPPVYDTRTLDQVRADLVCDLLLTGSPGIDPTIDTDAGPLGAIRATIQVTVPVTTLAGTDHRGASIAGRSPIDPDTARTLAGGAPGWDRVMTHPVTGTVLAVDRYRPAEQMKRYLRARDQHCRFPGCRQPARRCHLDHGHDHAKGGPTHIRNLCCLCVRHHTLKTETEWAVTQHPDGTLEWTTPLRHRHLDTPPPRVVFMPGEPPPPF